MPRVCCNSVKHVRYDVHPSKNTTLQTMGQRLMHIGSKYLHAKNIIYGDVTGRYTLPRFRKKEETRYPSMLTESLSLLMNYEWQCSQM